VEYVADSDRNPFGLSPACDRFVPGYGDVNADFHIIGDHPGVHGGLASGLPFADRPWSEQFFETLVEAGLLRAVDLEAGAVTPYRTFLSYLHMCEPASGMPDEDSYGQMEPFFDAELRAITAHVLLPVGARATTHVLESYTARVPEDPPDMDTLHATESRGSGWLVIPIKDPVEWTGDDATHLVESIRHLEEADYHQVSDLGRFIPGGDSYLVR
jgi:uracil-DNA glycosylase